MKKNTKLLAAAALIIGLSAAGYGAVHAATSSGTNPMSNLVSAIAQRFNLNPTDVQKVFDEQRSQIQAQHEQFFTDRVNQLVKDGKLTQDQANKILAKKAELEAFEKTLAGKTPQERRDAMQAEMNSLKQWAKDNNIPLGNLLFGGMKMGHFRNGHMGGMHGWMMGSSTPTPSQ